MFRKIAVAAAAVFCVVSTTFVGSAVAETSPRLLADSTPITGCVDQTTTVHAYGFTPSEDYTITADNGAVVDAEVTANEDGAFVLGVTMPDAQGTVVVTAHPQEDPTVSTASVEIQLHRRSVQEGQVGTPGDLIDPSKTWTVLGWCFTPGATATLSSDELSLSQTSAVVDQDGKLAVRENSTILRTGNATVSVTVDGVTTPSYAIVVVEDHLDAGTRLSGFESNPLRSANRRYVLYQQATGLELMSCLYECTAIWNSGPQNSNVSSGRLILTTDGDLQLATDSVIYWHTGTSGSGTKLTLGDDGNLVLTNSAGTTLWSSKTDRTVRTTAHAYDELPTGTSMRSASGYHLDLDGTGVLAVRSPANVVLWQTHTAKNAYSDYAYLLSNGEFFLRGAPNTPDWSTYTSDPDHDPTLTLHDDGDLVLTAHDGTELWSSRVDAKFPQALRPGMCQSAGEGVRNASGAHALVRTDGNVVVYNQAGHGVWSSHTSGEGNKLCMSMQSNLYVRSNTGRVLWATRSNIADSDFDLVRLQSDNDLVVRNMHGKAVWASKYGLLVENSLAAGHTLDNKHALCSRNGYCAKIYEDAELRITAPPAGALKWRTGSYFNGHPIHLVLRSDGNLALYNSAGHAVWQTHTSGRNTRLVMEPSGILVLLSSTGHVLWHTTT